MTASKNKNRNKTVLYWAAIIIIAITGIYIHLDDLEKDPPLYFDGHGQSLSTDPYQYTYFARNKLLFDEAEIFDSANWRVFEYSITSGLSYLLFSLFGISRYMANLTGLILLFISIGLFFVALKKFIPAQGILIALIFLMFNNPLFVYGRLPFLENGMIFWIALTFLIYVYYRQKLMGQICLGITVTLAALSGKIFGFIILVPMVILIWNEYRDNWIKPVSVIIFATVGMSLLWILLIHGGDLKLFMSYYSSQTVGLYGIPDALKSPIAFFERLISFGSDTRFYWHAPALGLAGIAGIIAVLMRTCGKKQISNVLLFFTIWFFGSQLFFMVSNYRPLRYIYMLYFPLAGMAAFVFSFSTEKIKLSLEKNVKKYIALFFIIWIVLVQLILNVFYLNYLESMYRTIVWICAPAALVIIFLEWRFNLFRFLDFKYLKSYAIVLLLLLSVCNFGWFWNKWNIQKSYNIREAGNDIGQILGDNAVISGPMAATLLLENNLKGIIYAVGITDSDSLFFSKQPITHFLIDAEASYAIIKKYPELTKIHQVAEYWIRDSKILLVRINDLSGNETAAKYQPSDFELSRSFMENDNIDSALFYIEKFAGRYPRNKSCLKTLAALYPLSGQPDRGINAFQNATRLYPRDFSLHLMLGAYYQQKSVLSGDKNFLALARKSYETAGEINPFQWDEITALAEKIAGK